MDKVTPPELKHRQVSQRDDELAAARELADELERLVRLKGWTYAKRVSMANVIKQFECDPPKTDTERTRWETYNTVRWAFERFFSLVEQMAANPPPTPQKDSNGDNRRQSN